MKDIGKVIRTVIKQRILPQIKRDGIRKLLLPEQIALADCVKPTKREQPCSLEHSEPELIISLGGKAPYRIADKTFIFTLGKMVLMPGGTPHAPAQTTRWFTGNIEIGRSASLLFLGGYPSGVRVQVVRIDDALDSADGTHPCVLLDRQSGRLMNSLVEEVHSRRPGYTRIGRYMLLEFMERCLRASSAGANVADALTVLPRRKRSRAASKRIPNRILAAQAFIHSNYHMPLVGLDDIAHAADTSTGYLVRQFKSAIGMTPAKYLLEVRMEAARQLLMTDLNVGEVGHLAGINDPAYFSRVFRRSNGVSPVTYRRRKAESDGRDDAESNQ